MSAVGLGAFEVRAHPAEVAAFRHAARLEGDALPFIFPIRWLACQQLRVGAMALVPETGLVPFHESQTFAYAGPLLLDVAYVLTASARRETMPDRLVIQGEVADSDGSVVVGLETVLRLFPTGQATA